MLKLIGKYLKKYWFLALLGPIFMILEVGCDMVLNEFMSNIINAIQSAGSEGTIEVASMLTNTVFSTPVFNLIGKTTMEVPQFITINGICMIITVIIGGTCGILSGVFVNKASFKATNDMRKDCFAKIMSLSYNQTDKFSTSSLVIRVTNDIVQIQNLITMSLRMLIRNIAMFAFGIILTISISPIFARIIFIVLPIEILIMAGALIVLMPHFKTMQEKIDRVNTVVHENVTGARVVKAFKKEDFEKDRFDKVNNDYAAKLLKVSKVIAILMPLMMLLIYTAQIAIYRLGGQTIVDGFNNGKYGDMIMIGDLNRAIIYVTMICFSLMFGGMIILRLIRAKVSANRICEVMNMGLEIVDGIEDFTISDDEKGTVEFDNVCFRYPDTNEDVLSNLNFKIKKGETIAIVGATGSGKTSIANLITRFYDVTGGRVLIDGHDIKDFKQQDLRARIAVCLQKSELFSGTIKENILWGKEDATEEELNQAINISQAREFVDTRPHGVDEYVEEKGTSLSGGQKQRLSIARAIIKNPEILIFDDSTSALDLVTEAKLYADMRKYISNVTKISIVQRIASAQNADRIIVLDNGKIIRFDTHDNLMKDCKLYIDIYNSQLKEGGVIDE